NFLMFCLWRGAQMHLARHAVLAVKGGLVSVFGATGNALVQRSFFLLESARHAAGAGATRRAALCFLIFFWL
ncbi:hypothetical protein A2U01_0095130, partial [Trifolium medium]|nr:hypothetical protein [Trifolium medium]